MTGSGRNLPTPGNPFRLVTSGTFFAWVRHPFTGRTGREVARRLVQEAGLLCLPGEVFGPGLTDYLRLAFGNIREGNHPGCSGAVQGVPDRQSWRWLAGTLTPVMPGE